MTVLDDPAALRAADPGGMLDIVTHLADQCREGYALGLAASPLPEPDGVTSVAFCGMGGSAIAGDVVAALAAPRLRLPVLTVRAPELPEFCGPHTVVVASSYSGDTAETLALFEEAAARGCRLVAITSGGQLDRRAEELGVGRVLVPGGQMPRAAFGYLSLGALGALEAMGIVPTHAEDVAESIEELAGLVSEAGPGRVARLEPRQGARERARRPRPGRLGRRGDRRRRRDPVEVSVQRERQGAGVRVRAPRARSQRGRRMVGGPW